MATTLKNLKQRIDELQRKAERLRVTEVKGVVGRIREAIVHYGLAPKDLFGAPPQVLNKATVRGEKNGNNASPLTGRKVPIKYRDRGGNTWTGRGTKPRWLTAAIAEGEKVEDFAVG